MKHQINTLKEFLKDKKYLILVIILFAAFSAMLIFSWNLILFRDMYVRKDLWTAWNIFFLFSIPLLSSLIVSYNVKLIKNEIKAKKSFLAVLPSFFASACPTCAPLILSFVSTTYAIGMALAKVGFYIKAASLVLLFVTLMYILSPKVCKIKQ